MGTSQTAIKKKNTLDKQKSSSQVAQNEAGQTPNRDRLDGWKRLGFRECRIEEEKRASVDR